jgi:hypothetical protein
MSFKLVIFTTLFSLSLAQPLWKDETDGSWAYFCDFAGNDLSSQSSWSLTDCQAKCRQAAECTHYTWVASSAVCYLKRGIVSKQNGFYLNNNQYACGLLYKGNLIYF